MTPAERYVGWLERRRGAIVLATVLILAGSLYLVAFHLPLHADFSHLLPADAPAVKEADRLAQRMPAQDSILMIVVARDDAEREAAAQLAAGALREIDRDLVERVESDDRDVRELVRAHRHLFVPLRDLETARDALANRLADARRRANPLFVDLEDRPRDTALDELRARQHSALAQLDRSAHVSADRTTHLIVIRTAFKGTDVDRDIRILAQLDGIAARVRAAHPHVEIGIAGGPVLTVAEHRALTQGMLRSSAITFVLVAAVLLLHLRSVRVIGLLTINIVLAAIVAFGIAAIVVGHLNAATAFLGAIIAGNGINYGILLVARYLEERPRHATPRTALAAAIAGTVRPTLIASLGAAVAYGALFMTAFRGFADFAAIGAIGMLVCWLCSYMLLPLAILQFAPTPRRAIAPLFGRIVVALFGFRRPVIVLVVGGVIAIAAGVVSWRYIANDPYEYDLGEMRSQAPDAEVARTWQRHSDIVFGRGHAGLGGQTFIAVDRDDQVEHVVDALAEVAKREPLVGSTRSILDVVPRDQPKKLVVLAEIRRIVDELAPYASDDQLAAHRPPDDLREITPRDLPASIAAKLVERDGHVGRIIAVRPIDELDVRDGHQLIRFAEAIRQVKLANGETVAATGAGVVFADILIQIQIDGPSITLVALLGIMLVVLLVAGWSRRSFAVLVSTATGSLAMVAICALAGLRVNFLDFVALPITLGLGIDYAINVADRAASDPRAALRTTGGTVLVCSLTTTIGYASLLVSDNGAIRGFGLASLVGEITCVIAALTLVPAIASAGLPGRAAPRSGAESITALRVSAASTTGCSTIAHPTSE